MAAGKTTIGQSLAQNLQYDFLDTDLAIEKLTGESISELFKNRGEATFRQEEQKILSLAMTLDKIIIATGGGMPVFNGNLQKMLLTGTTIFLETDLDILSSRLRQADNRPLHQGYKKLDLNITKRYAERLPYYREAHLTILNNGTADESVQLILQKLNLK